MEEFELIQLLKKGDNSAYRSVIDSNQAMVLNCCYRFVKNKETAEDLTQEVFIEAHRSINFFRAESKLSTWLIRIAITKSLDYLKSMKRKKRFGFLKSLFGDEENEEIQPVSDLRSPQQILENEDRIKVLSWAIDSLPENQKVAFTLSKYDELSYKEIAEILNTTVASVESLIFRAKSNLKKKLYGYYKSNL
jgi:RNA polymerase sigma-70 factor (ECF subfamily)